MIHQYDDHVICDCCKEETNEAYVIAYDKLCMECLKELHNELKGMFRNESEEIRKVLDTGELLIKTDEGIYFLAPTVDSIPLLIDEDEGERLLSESE